MRVLAETAVGREMDGFEEVDADDGVHNRVAATVRPAARRARPTRRRHRARRARRWTTRRRRRDSRFSSGLFRRRVAGVVETGGRGADGDARDGGVRRRLVVGAANGDVGLVVVGARLETVATTRKTSDSANGVEDEARADDSRGEFEYRAFDAATGETRWSETCTTRMDTDDTRRDG